MGFFLNPFALGAFAAVPVLIGIYYLRNRFQRRVVSTLFLWEGVVRAREGGRRKDRLLLPWTVILEVLALLCLVVAASKPYFWASTNRIPVIVILDDSFSMTAIESRNGKESSPRDRAFETLEELNKTGRYEFEFFLAGAEPRRLGRDQVPGRQSLEFLQDHWKCQQPAADIVSTVQTVRDIYQEDRRILVLTDHFPAESPLLQDYRVRWMSFGVPVENCAVSFAARQDPFDSDSDQSEKLLVRIERFSPGDKGTRDLEVAIRDADLPEDANLLARAEVKLTGSSAEEVQIVIPESARNRNLKVSIGDDALRQDNQLVLLAPAGNRLDIVLQFNDKEYLKYWTDVLKLVPGISVNEVSLTKADLVISDEELDLQDDQWQVLCPEQKKPIAFAGPFALNSDHPLVVGLPITKAIWAADEYQEPELPKESADQPGSSEDKSKSKNPITSSRRRINSRSVIRAGQTDLVSETVMTRNRRRIRINLRPRYSTLHLSPPSWLVLVVNLVQYRRQFMFGPQEVNSWQDTQSIRFPAAVEAARLTSPDGTDRDVPVIDGIAQVEMKENGVWKIRAIGPELETGEPYAWSWSHFSAAGHESDLADASTESTDNWQELEAGSRTYYRPFSWLFGFIGFFLVLACLYFNHRKAVR